MLDGGWWPGPFHLLKALACFGALSLRARMRLLRIAPALLAIRLGGSSHLRGLCVREWLRQEGQDEETIRVLWDPLILACLNTPPKEAAAEVFAQVAAHLFTGGRKNACFGTGHYGLEALLGTPARTFIENHGGEVHTRTAVRKIRIENRRVTGICLADGSWQTADAYILAVPPPAVLSLLPESEKTREPFSALHNYEPSAICTLYLWTDREITSLPFAHMRTRRFEWIFNLQAMMPRQKFSGPVYGLENSAADWMMPWTHKQMIEAAREDIEACFPDAKGFQILHTSISKDRQATFQAVPSLEARRLSAATPLDNLFLAGDWTRTGYPGTIEGAVKSGRRCANAIHAEFEQKGKIHAANKGGHAFRTRGGILGAAQCTENETASIHPQPLAAAETHEKTSSTPAPGAFAIFTKYVNLGHLRQSANTKEL